MEPQSKSTNEKYMIFNRLLLAHVFIGSLGLLKFISIVAVIVNEEVIARHFVLIDYNYWADLSMDTPIKPAQILQYILSVVGLFFCYAYFIVLRDRAEILLHSRLVTTIVENARSRTCYYISLLALNVIVVLYSQYNVFLLSALSTMWFVAFILPVLPLVYPAFKDKENVKLRKWCGLALVIVTAEVFWLFVPYCLNRVPVINEYMDIPSLTKLGDRYVDNTEYINEHTLGNLNKYDPRKDKGASPVPRPDEYIPMSNSALIVKFLSQKEAKTRYAYNEKVRGLVVKGKMSLDERETLIHIAKNEAEREAINGYYLKETKSRTYSNEEIEFVNKNGPEFNDQSIAGHFFHHHNAMYGPINEYALGKPMTKITFTYGYLSTIIITKLTNYLGGVTFDNYIRVSYAFYPLYFLFMMAAAAIIFRRLSYVLLVTIISAIFIHMLGFESIRFAPGLNPIRHFADMFVLAFFFLYLSSNRWKQLFLVLAFGFSIFELLLNIELGLILFVSLVAATTIFIIRRSESKFNDLVILSIATAVAAISVVRVLSESNKNSTLVYNLLGVAAPSIPMYLLVGLTVLISAVYVFLLYARRMDDRRWRYLMFFWFAYGQGLIVYFVWNPAPNHFVSFGLIWALLGAMFAKNVFVMMQQEKHENSVIALSAFALALTVYVLTFLYYIHDQRAHFRYFDDHKIYQWDFPTAKFVTTMDPMYFKDAVGLIQKYEQGKGIYILSKYDNILPFLAGKYSAMPFVETGLSLVTKKEINLCVKLIDDNRSAFLFIDTDLSRSYLGDIYDPENKITKLLNTFKTSRGRAMVLENLHELNDKIKDKYLLVERGLLISVYKRKSDSER